MVEVKALGPLHVLKQWLGGKQWHTPCETLSLHKASFVSVEFHGDHKTAYKDEVNLATLSSGGITGYKAVMSACPT